MIKFCVGMFVGAFIGAGFMCLAWAGGREEK